MDNPTLSPVSRYTFSAAAIRVEAIETTIVPKTGEDGTAKWRTEQLRLRVSFRVDESALAGRLYTVEAHYPRRIKARVAWERWPGDHTLISRGARGRGARRHLRIGRGEAWMELKAACRTQSGRARVPALLAEIVGRHFLESPILHIELYRSALGRDPRDGITVCSEGLPLTVSSSDQALDAFALARGLCALDPHGLVQAMHPMTQALLGDELGLIPPHPADKPRRTAWGGHWLLVNDCALFSCGPFSEWLLDRLDATGLIAHPEGVAAGWACIEHVAPDIFHQTRVESRKTFGRGDRDAKREMRAARYTVLAANGVCTHGLSEHERIDLLVAAEAISQRLTGRSLTELAG